MLRNVRTLTQAMRRNWRVLLQGGAWVMALLASFVLPPPLWDLRQRPVWFRFSHFLVSALIGLMFIPMSVWASKRHRWRWMYFSAAALAAGVSLFFVYQSLRDHWTNWYAGRPIVIGRTYRKDALEYKTKVRNEEGRDIPDDELIMDSAGRTETIWDVSEIRQRALILAGVYLGSISLFAIGVISVVQTLYCNSRRR